MKKKEKKKLERVVEAMICCMGDREACKACPYYSGDDSFRKCKEMKMDAIVLLLKRRH